MSEPTKSGSIYRRGNTAAFWLVVITVIELILALTFESAILLILLSIGKAGIILQVFMNISRLWNPEEHH
ncbi:MAG: hypothetical protein QNJ45_14675 [Ardenticatenaceae bacterium]|nr:hypothetical protein [Ardenticatenaceae bacterium]